MLFKRTNITLEKTSYKNMVKISKCSRRKLVHLEIMLTGRSQTGPIVERIQKLFASVYGKKKISKAASFSKPGRNENSDKGETFRRKQLYRKAVRADLQCLSTTMSEMLDRIAELETALAAEQARTTQLRHDLEEEQARTADLQQRLDKTDRALATEQAEVRHLKNEIMRMEEDHSTNKTAWEKQMNEIVRPDIAAIAHEVIHKLWVSSMSCSAQARLFCHYF
jgi:chromosome segregation ATPase